jgi:hypothetical protein
MGDNDAEFYQAHKDDSEVWGEAEGIRGEKPERRRLNAMVSVRLTPDEEDALRAEAERRGLSLSALIRHTVIRELAPRATIFMMEIQGTGTEAAKSVPEMRPSENIAVTATADVQLRKIGP